MLLSILIPTYNRSKFLIRNLEILHGYVSQLSDEMEIIVSNNNSTDSTDEDVARFCGKHHINLRYYRQETNIGLERNALFVLQKAFGEYVMYLGDDDYLEFDFLKNVLSYLKNEDNLSAIVPNNYTIDLNGNPLSKARDFQCLTTINPPGFRSCYRHSWRGHQLSGLVLRREGLYEAYITYSVSNIYPFIFFVAFQSMRGKVVHYVEYPVRVTMPGQQNKDWSYGKDGLLNEVFDNYKKLPISSFRRALLQLYIVKEQPFRLWIYRRISIKHFLKAIWIVWTASNAVFLFRPFFPFLVASIEFRIIAGRIVRILGIRK